ncbi:MAG: UDP-N-acetylmuramate--L-alanine ligase [Lachnospiraceae bacterium]|nr:UDP-N-acetylmuramate--L-alanine ligase [Lachnospiraceae bacterium]
MYNIDFNKPIHVHFIGIGGISMSALAKLLLSKGFKVTGSDRQKSAITEDLEADGAEIMLGQRAANITDDIDVVIYTAAVHEDNEELMAVRQHNIPALTRAELMGQVMKQYPAAVGISGTHGKTTTTGMLSVMLMDANMDPTVSIGGILPEIGSQFRIGEGKHFVVESCEYTNSFLSFFPTDAIILNIEADHLDFFKDLDDIRNSFAGFGKLVPSEGLLIVNSEIDKADELFKGCGASIKTYGLCENGEAADSYNYAAADISYDDQGRGIYNFYEDGRLLGEIRLGVVGRHNISNSLPAIAMALKYGVPFETVQKSVCRYNGTKRRFEYKGSLGEIDIYDDYAHHPTEIAATLTAAKNGKHKRVITVFQPHTYSRTKALLNGFAEALSLSDVVVLADIYAAREINTGEVSSADIMALLKEKGNEVYHFHSFDEIENFLLEFATSGDMLITMGAGDVVNIGDSLLGR